MQKLLEVWVQVSSDLLHSAVFSLNQCVLMNIFMCYFPKQKIPSTCHVFPVLKVFVAYKTAWIGLEGSWVFWKKLVGRCKAYIGQLIISETGLDPSLGSCTWRVTQLIEVACLSPTSTFICEGGWELHEALSPECTEDDYWMIAAL